MKWFLQTLALMYLYISMDGRYVLQGAVTDLELMANLSTNRVNASKQNMLRQH